MSNSPPTDLLNDQSISHIEWLRLLDQYPKGLHPLNDLYTEEITLAIGKSLGIKPDDLIKLSRLRYLLASAAEVIVTYRRTVGSKCSLDATRALLNDQILEPGRDLERALKELPKASFFEWSPVGPEVEVQTRILQRFLTKYEEKLASIDYSRNNRTWLLSDYKHRIVMQLAQVYARLLPDARVSRINDAEGTYGQFSDFIREAGRPLLELEVSPTDKRFKNHATFARQIQDVVKEIGDWHYERMAEENSSIRS